MKFFNHYLVSSSKVNKVVVSVTQEITFWQGLFLGLTTTAWQLTLRSKTDSLFTSSVVFQARSKFETLVVLLTQQQRQQRQREQQQLQQRRKILLKISQRFSILMRFFKCFRHRCFLRPLKGKPRRNWSLFNFQKNDFLLFLRLVEFELFRNFCRWANSYERNRNVSNFLRMYTHTHTLTPIHVRIHTRTHARRRQACHTQACRSTR